MKANRVIRSSEDKLARTFSIAGRHSLLEQYKVDLPRPAPSNRYQLYMPLPDRPSLFNLRLVSVHKEFASATHHKGSSSE